MSFREVEAVEQTDMAAHVLKQHLWDNEELYGVVSLTDTSALGATSRGLMKCELTPDGPKIDRVSVDSNMVEEVEITVEQSRDPLIAFGGAVLSFGVSLLAGLYAFVQGGKKSRATLAVAFLAGVALTVVSGALQSKPKATVTYKHVNQENEKMQFEGFDDSLLPLLAQAGGG